MAGPKRPSENAYSKTNAYRGPLSGRFREIDRRVCDFVIEKHILVTSLFLKISLEKRARLTIRVVLYSGQYGS